ncbi:hypothetical protein [Acidovorax carolinensis]|uniref:hypothetical protein n=1 Tax=Acidovorax carolinensis TaxID=553814 RepID=UPI00138FC89A|nr:hypothetical protein [Acidovorax carolinensis]
MHTQAMGLHFAPSQIWVVWRSWITAFCETCGGCLSIRVLTFSLLCALLFGILHARHHRLAICLGHGVVWLACPLDGFSSCPVTKYARRDAVAVQNVPGVFGGASLAGSVEADQLAVV